MGIKEMLKKFANREMQSGPGITPDEVELQSYLLKERRRRVKAQLAYYRNREAKEIWGPSTFSKGDGSIIKSKNVFRRR